MAKSKLVLVSILALSFVLESCHYVPFIKYSKSKDRFPKFSKKEKLAGSQDSKLRAFDVLVYDWTIEPIASKEKIKGRMRIVFKAEADLSEIMLDLQGSMKVSDIRSESVKVGYKHKGDLLYLNFKEPLLKGSQHEVTIDYSGKPRTLLGNGTISWKEDTNGKPFISTLTQGIGPHFIMPCKNLLYDEPDSSFIRVTASNDLIGVANGKLLKVTEEGERKTWHYGIKNPINVYNISFNIGDYTEISFPYVDVQNIEREIEIWALRQDSIKAYEFYSQTPRLMKELEEIYGPFPWWEDGCKILQTAISGGAMEHQSAISMGSILYNTWKPDSGLHANSTLAHELAHEWWGNSITARDYGDAWLHEGMASYAEALVAERLYGEEAYLKEVILNVNRYTDKRPAIKPFGVQYNSWVNSRDFNIYSKGALFMHTLRTQIDNDSLFFEVYKDATLHFDRKQISTKELAAFFAEKTKMNLEPLFDAYLRRAKPPILEYALDTNSNKFLYRWKEVMPYDFEMWVLLHSGANSEKLVPSQKIQSIPVQSNSEITMSWPEFGYALIEKNNILLETPIEEQENLK